MSHKCKYSYKSEEGEPYCCHQNAEETAPCDGTLQDKLNCPNWASVYDLLKEEEKTGGK